MVHFRQGLIMTYPTVQTYDFPQSPILWIGFVGIIVALATLYVVNVKYAKHQDS